MADKDYSETEADRRIHSQFCLASARLEGFEPDPAFIELTERYVQDTITADQLVEIVLQDPRYLPRA